MSKEYAETLDHAISSALYERIVVATDRDAMHRDLSALRSIHSRAPNTFLRQSLEFLLKSLPDDDPDRDRLAAELAVIYLGIAVAGPRNFSYGRPKSTQVIVSVPSPALDLPSGLPSFDPDTRWPWPPLFLANWMPLEKGEAEEATRIAHGAFPQSIPKELAARVIAARATALSCYPGFRVVELLLKAEDRSTFSHLGIYSAEMALLIDGSSPAIHMLNSGIQPHSESELSKVGPLDISTIEKAAEYLRFFCGCVHGDAGPFNIVENRDQLGMRWLGEPAKADEIAAHLSPVHAAPIENSSDNDASDFNAKPPATNGSGQNVVASGTAGWRGGDGAETEKGSNVSATWKLDATVLYSNRLFKSTFLMHKTGNIEMKDDIPLAANLPVIRDGCVIGYRMAGRP